jgi:integrase
MLEALPKKKKRVFGAKTYGGISSTFCNSRKKAARKLQNLRLLKIHFHTLRQWKATMLYHQTRDILQVMNFLGHKNIRNTMLYIQLEHPIFKEASDEFTCKIAKDAQEAKILVETGFDYVCTTPEGSMMFRKRK